MKREKKSNEKKRQTKGRRDNLIKLRQRIYDVIIIFVSCMVNNLYFLYNLGK